MTPLQKGREAIFPEHEWGDFDENDIKYAPVAHGNGENTPKVGRNCMRFLKTE